MSASSLFGFLEVCLDVDFTDLGLDACLELFGLDPVRICNKITCYFMGNIV
jgi:hypothetical protein